MVHKYQFYGIQFTFINSLYNYYELLDVFFVVSCAEIMYLSTTNDIYIYIYICSPTRFTMC